MVKKIIQSASFLINSFVIFILFFNLLTIITGCESQLSPQIISNYEGNKLNLQGMISPDSVKIQLSQSLSPFENHQYKDFFIKKGVIKIYDSQTQLLATLTSSDDLHFNFYKKSFLQAEQKYKLVASAEGLDEVTTDWIIIPPKTAHTLDFKIIDLQIGEYTAEVEGSSSSFNANYYHAAFIVIHNGKRFFNYLTPNNMDCIKSATFSNTCIDGNKATLKYYFPHTANIPFFGLTVVDTLVYRFGSVSKEAFLWQESKEESDDSFLEGINQEPIPSYTNVKNGYGVVFGQNWESELNILK
ncbi:MAG: hypothetical protein RLZZ292_3652 [Bacteroidota bacterium]|jgi:hypothetical protein